MMINIFVTKEIYRRSMMCGVFNDLVGDSCAVALAVREIAPKAIITYTEILWTGGLSVRSYIPMTVTEMILKFDDLFKNPELRLDLPEFSFEVDFPDQLVEQIGIDQVREILTNSETLKEA